MVLDVSPMLLNLVSNLSKSLRPLINSFCWVKSTLGKILFKDASFPSTNALSNKMANLLSISNPKFFNNCETEGLVKIVSKPLHVESQSMDNTINAKTRTAVRNIKIDIKIMKIFTATLKGNNFCFLTQKKTTIISTVNNTIQTHILTILAIVELSDASSNLLKEL